MLHEIWSGSRTPVPDHEIISRAQRVWIFVINRFEYTSILISEIISAEAL